MRKFIVESSRLCSINAGADTTIQISQDFSTAPGEAGTGGETMASDEVNALKDIAGKIDELGEVGREIDNLKRAVEVLTSELKEVRKFQVMKDLLDDTNDNLAKIVDELRKIREKG